MPRKSILRLRMSSRCIRYELAIRRIRPHKAAQRRGAPHCGESSLHERQSHTRRWKQAAPSCGTGGKTSFLSASNALLAAPPMLEHYKNDVSTDLNLSTSDSVEASSPVSLIVHRATTTPASLHSMACEGVPSDIPFSSLGNPIKLLYAALRSQDLTISIVETGCAGLISSSILLPSRANPSLCYGVLVGSCSTGVRGRIPPSPGGTSRMKCESKKARAGTAAPTRDRFGSDSATVELSIAEEVEAEADSSWKENQMSHHVTRADNYSRAEYIHAAFLRQADDRWGNIRARIHMAVEAKGKVAKA
ncbi:hypothetical protein CALCODRAFT_465225 [Calocera cornea HHB12733]|uniref:Uncharacterized protein n=1 Tax=Calocera cornea HHB12733 TaxID=1353952 RepID=A0A165IJQ5_9BASI|nr:hypothetical protein CALCODRAFT_465225 [Calocera cornea HHB12733]